MTQAELKKGDFVDLREDPRIGGADKLLPAWLTVRMMSDSWAFGLLLVTGKVLCIECIEDISVDASGTLWLDVKMLTEAPLQSEHLDCVVAPTSRRDASINASHVVAAFELADT